MQAMYFFFLFGIVFFSEVILNFEVDQGYQVLFKTLRNFVVKYAQITLAPGLLIKKIRIICFLKL